MWSRDTSSVQRSGKRKGGIGMEGGRGKKGERLEWTTERDTYILYYKSTLIFSIVKKGITRCIVNGLFVLSELPHSSPDAPGGAQG